MYIDSGKCTVRLKTKLSIFKTKPQQKLNKTKQNNNKNKTSNLNKTQQNKCKSYIVNHT
jgi:hypothetical protein